MLASEAKKAEHTSMGSGQRLSTLIAVIHASAEKKSAKVRKTVLGKTLQAHGASAPFDPTLSLYQKECTLSGTRLVSAAACAAFALSLGACCFLVTSGTGGGTGSPCGTAFAALVTLAAGTAFFCSV